MEHFNKVARWNEVPLATPAEIAARAQADHRIGQLKAEIAKVVAKGRAAEKAKLKPDAKPAKDENAFPDDVKKELARLRADLASTEKAVPVLPTAMAAGEGKVANAFISSCRPCIMARRSATPASRPIRRRCATSPIPGNRCRCNG
jgi:hypothetical protein